MNTLLNDILRAHGGMDRCQLTSDYGMVDGVCLPLKRRAYIRGPDRWPSPEMLIVSIDIGDVDFT